MKDAIGRGAVPRTFYASLSLLKFIVFWQAPWNSRSILEKYPPSPLSRQVSLVFLVGTLTQVELELTYDQQLDTALQRR